MDIGHDRINRVHEFCVPIVTEIRRGDGKMVTERSEVGLDLGQDLNQILLAGSLVDPGTVESFVANDHAFEDAAIGGVLEDLVHLSQLTVVGRDVGLDPYSEPDLHRGQAKSIDRVKHHLRLVAVRAIETNRVGELGQNCHVASDVVLRRWIFHAERILCTPRRIVYGRKYLV